jgi:hypothetical protein
MTTTLLRLSRTLLCTLAVLACRPYGPYFESDPPPARRDAPVHVSAQWRAAVQYFRDSGAADERGRLADGVGLDLPLALWTVRPGAEQGFSRAWLINLISDGTVDGLCGVARRIDCPWRGKARYLRLFDPTDWHGDTVTVRVESTITDYSTCGTEKTSALGGEVYLYLIERAGDWRVARAESGSRIDEYKCTITAD